MHQLLLAELPTTGKERISPASDSSRANPTGTPGGEETNVFASFGGEEWGGGILGGNLDEFPHLPLPTFLPNFRGLTNWRFE